MIRNSTSKHPGRIVTFVKIVSSLIRIAILVSMLFLAGTIQAIYSQAPPSCPTSASSIPAEFRPQNLGDSTTVTIDLAPCETVEVHESHDMGGDGNRGTILKVSYLNASGQELAARTIYGFDSATDNTFPLSTSYDEPFPWVGVRAPVVLPLTLKIESTSLYGQGNPPSPPLYTFTIIKTPRPGYNVGGYDFASAPLVPSLPTTYKGSLRQGVAFDCTTNCTGSPPQSPPDPGQYFKVHLCVGQTIYVYGTAKENTYYGGHFTAEIYNSAQQYLIPLVNVDVWAGHDGTFTSNPFTNPNATDAGFYIRVWSRNWAIQDFQLTIDSYVASNNQSNPRPIAPDATGSGGSVSSEEYHLPASNDNDVLTGRMTELWAKLYWPTDFSGGPYPLVLFLHGNHATCGRSSNPRIDHGYGSDGYTYSGTCGSAPFVDLATASGGASRNDLTGWYGMKITIGPQPIIVSALGRIFIGSSSLPHVVKIVRASDNASVAVATVTKTQPFDNISYASLGSPVTLAANTSYYVVSQELSGGDAWFDSVTVSGTNVAAVSGTVSSADGLTNWNLGSSAGLTHGPVDILYDFTGSSGYSVVQNHLGYDYLATQLASRGYVIASINANRGITDTASPDSSYPDDPLHIFSRGRLVLRHLQTLSSWNSEPTAFITPTSLGTLRRNSNNWFGMKITVGPQPITVHSFGRIFVSGNSGTHTVKIVRASDSVDLASVSIPMTGGTAGQFKYVNLASPVTLAANTSYYIASKELKNGDYWYDSNTTVTSTSVAIVNGRVTSTNGTSWNTSGAVPNHVYVPLDFKYQVQQVLSVNLTGKIDFTNVGLMGHSRGGQGVRAAYNLYRNPSIDPRSAINPIDPPWSSRIIGMNLNSIKGIFEIGPTDFVLPTASDGSGNQWLNADGTAWNVLLPMCDGDVTDLQGVRVLDRMMAMTDSPATQKSSYTVWGTNHNFYNSEWQQSDFYAVCRGSGNTQLFANPATDGNGSPNQRTIGSASALALLRANVGASASPNFNQDFNPRYTVPPVVTSITRVDQGFTPSPNLSTTKVLFDFLPFSSWPAETTVDTLNIPDPIFGTIVPNHAPSLSAGLVTWNSSGCGAYLQTNWRNPSTGDNIAGYQTLDFRVSRKDDPLNSSDSSNFQIQLIAANGSPTGAAVSLNKYISLTGPVGIQDVSGLGDGLHPILQTVRIPLSDFTNANLTQIRGVRFIFSDTGSGAVFITNLRLSNQP